MEDKHKSRSDARHSNNIASGAYFIAICILAGVIGYFSIFMNMQGKKGSVNQIALSAKIAVESVKASDKVEVNAQQFKDISYAYIVVRPMKLEQLLFHTNKRSRVRLGYLMNEIVDDINTFSFVSPPDGYGELVDVVNATNNEMYNLALCIKELQINCGSNALASYSEARARLRNSVENAMGVWLELYGF